MMRFVTGCKAFGFWAKKSLIAANRSATQWPVIQQFGGLEERSESKSLLLPPNFSKSSTAEENSAAYSSFPKNPIARDTVPTKPNGRVAACGFWGDRPASREKRIGRIRRLTHKDSLRIGACERKDRDTIQGAAGGKDSLCAEQSFARLEANEIGEPGRDSTRTGRIGP